MSYGTAVVLLLFLSACGTMALPWKLSTDTDQGGRHRSLHQLAPQLTQRVFFDPNRGEDNKAEDYIANVYIGDISFVEADPAAAGVGGAASAGVQLTYDKQSYFDDEYPKARADIGPGAKAVGAAVARILGLATAKTAGKGFGKSNLSYKRDAFNENSAQFGTVNEIGAGVSAGVFLDRAAGEDDGALGQTPNVNFVFGH